MTGPELRELIEGLWPAHGAQTRAGEYLGVRSSRIREWLREARPIPEGVASEMLALATQFPGGIRNVNPRVTVRVLQQQMQESGWGEAAAAAGILGAALGNAQKYLDADKLEEVLASGRAHPGCYEK